MTEVRVIDCEEALRGLFAYLDAELTGEPQREMQQHIERCRSCFSRLEFERRLKAHTATLRAESVPEDLQQRIQKLLATFS